MLGRGIPALRRQEAPTARHGGDIFDVMESMLATPLERFGFGQSELPAVNVKETDGEINVQAELPGMEANDLDISLQNGNLVIQGEKKFEDEQDKDNYRRVERAYGSFYRAVPLPAEVDENNIKAKFEKGVLKVSVPKTGKDKGKKIEIESS